jgi:galactokinase
VTTLFLQQRWEESGLPEPVQAAYRQLLEEAQAVLNDNGVPQDGRRVWIVPGRIEVLGKHVDYAGGRSLLCAVERGIVLVARRREEATVVLRDARRREAMVMPLLNPQRSAIPWSVYPRTVTHRLVRNFGDAVRGMDVALASNLPPAAGVSSSSALTVGLTLAFMAHSSLASEALFREAIPNREALAAYIGALENGADFGVLGGERGVGTMGGAQDQTAILCSDSGRLDQFAWAPVRYERSVLWPTGHVFVVGVSGVTAAKSGAAKERYNRAARTAQRLVEAWNQTSGQSVHTLRDAVLAAAGHDRPTDVPHALMVAAEGASSWEFKVAHLRARLEQFVDETFLLVPGAAEALARGDLSAFGTMVDRSQAAAERALENQIAETVHLQRYARELGAVAASAFGAGFGGSVWAMVPEADVESFTSRWRELYLRAHAQVQHRAQFFATHPASPAFELI